jgi:hypothetical protein
VDATVLALWVIRLLFLALLYWFLWSVVRVLLGDLRAAAREPVAELGRLIVLASPSGEPPVGVVFGLEAVNTLGRDVNNSIVLDDEFVSAQHAALTFRGKAWYIEDLGSTNASYLNGESIVDVWPLTFGDEIQLGQVRLRLDRGHR